MTQSNDDAVEAVEAAIMDYFKGAKSLRGAALAAIEAMPITAHVNDAGAIERFAEHFGACTAGAGSLAERIAYSLERCGLTITAHVKGEEL